MASTPLRFPDGFVWGAATSSHQVEGGNVNNDWWAREHAPDSYLAEPSGDACDSYHRYPEDIRLLAELGLGSYRFSLEWSRIEPAEGEFSRAQIDHYRRMVDACLEAGGAPNVTLNHFTIPRWLDLAGGWLAPQAVDRFTRVTEAAEPIVGRDVEYVTTINEPNITACFAGMGADDTFQAAGLPAPDLRISEILIAAHHRAVEVIRSWNGPKAGWVVGAQVRTTVPGAAVVAQAYAYERETRFYEEARGDDWIAVQSYTRSFVGPDGPLPTREDDEQTLTGLEYYPGALGEAVARAAR